MVRDRTPPFLTRDLLRRPRRLSIVADVTCDCHSPCNVLPLYDRTTSFASPVRRLLAAPPLDLVALDNLPALLPRESAEDFSVQLLPHLAAFFDEGAVWRRARDIFVDRCRRLEA
jgi:saccharopine dehydrogenase (NAD+, L-lysine-forming)